MEVWGVELDESLLKDNEVEYLESLPSDVPALEWVWSEMDRIWDKLGLDNRKSLSEQPIGEFYGHPVWIMNGIFTGGDGVSRGHREVIARFLKTRNAREVADIGGGFGQLASSIREHAPETSVTIWDPYPSRLTVEAFSGDAQVEFVDSPGRRKFDALIAQDVLEHIEDPIGLAHEIAQACNDDGFLIFANCFHPVTKCHLPSTFHLRHTFPFVMRAMGLRYIGPVEGAVHAQIFQRSGGLSIVGARRAERVSKIFGPALNRVRKLAGRAKRTLLRR